MIYVLNIQGEPIMPCSESKCRKLLKNNKAKIFQREPFTIQLLFECESQTQEINLGIDAGSKIIGISATTKTKELFSAEYQLRNDISDLLKTRRDCRRTRRNRLRYRKPRFLNRVKTKHKGWLAPSVENKINNHIKIIQKIHKILPITKIILELANFDIQKLNNPDINKWDYQKGERLGFENVKSYVLYRDNYECQYCKGKSKDNRLEVHHIIQRKDDGSNNQENLMTLCSLHHKEVHEGKIELNVKGMKKKYKDATHMNIMKNFLYQRLIKLYSNIEITYGYITKQTRYNNNLPKEHRIDALCISGNPTAKQLHYWYFMKQVRKQNRQIHKNNILKGGKKKLNQSQYRVFNFRLFDKVKFEGKEYFIFGRRNSGYFDIRKLDGTKVNKGSISYKKLKLIQERKSILIERRMAIPPLP